MSRLDDALALAQRYSIIPIEPRGKKPLIAWSEYQHRRATAREVQTWFTQWPEANIAIVTGRISGIVVVDMDNEAAVGWVRSNMPPTSTYVKTGKGYHAYYKYPNDAIRVENKTRLTDGVDIRADGGYVLAPPSIHPSGAVYTWVENKERSMTEYPLHVWVDKQGIDLSSIKVSAPVDLEPVGEGERNDKAAKIVGKYVAKGIDTEDIFNILSAWNTRNKPPLSDKELWTIIASVQKTHARNHAINVSTSIAHEKPPKVKPPIPPVGGLLKQIVDYLDKATIQSVYDFNLAAAISLLGVVAGAKVETESGLRTNFYTMAIGPSGVGKSQPMSAITTLLLESESTKGFIGVNKVASGTAILTALEKNKVQLMLLDESPDLLSGIHNPLSAKANIPETLKELFSCADRPYTKSYAEKDKLVYIPYNNLCIYGTGTQNAFWNNFTSANVTDGFLARTFVFNYEGEIPRKKRKRDITVPDGLISDLAQIASLNVPMTGNLGVPKPIVVGIDDDADLLMQEWGEKYRVLQNDNRNDELGIASFYGRAEEHATKLALLDAVSDLEGLPFKPDETLEAVKKRVRIRKKNVEWAIALTDYIITTMIDEVKKRIGNSVIDALAQKVLSFIESKTKDGKVWIQRKSIMNAIRNLDATNFDTVINTLVMRDAIVVNNRVSEKNGRNIVEIALAVNDAVD